MEGVIPLPPIDAEQVLYTSNVSGFTPTTAEGALDALAGVRISESGSNANGSYVRFENGVQVCWRVFAATSGITASLRTSTPPQYFYDVTWTLPAAFNAAPVVVANGSVTVDGPYYMGNVGYNGTTAGTTAELRVWSPMQFTGIPHLVALAIGAWK